MSYVPEPTIVCARMVAALCAELEQLSPGITQKVEGRLNLAGRALEERDPQLRQAEFADANAAAKAFRAVTT